MKKVGFRFPSRAAASRPHPPKALPDMDNRLFEKLRQLRRQLALKEGVPAYVVFSDRSLIEMARPSRPPRKPC